MSADENRMRERLIELLAKLDRIREAAKTLGGDMGDGHGDDCPHRMCDDGVDCSDGTHVNEGKGPRDQPKWCDAVDVECNCGTLAFRRLLAAIDGAP